jgi:hypothetical protein
MLSVFAKLFPRSPRKSPVNFGVRPQLLIISAVFLTACSTVPADTYTLNEIPDTSNYCLAAQRVVTRTDIPMTLVVHEDFDAYVKSKTSIKGPTIHQYNWYDDAGAIQGISCKMKSADHLNLEFGEGSAGPDGLCHDMNRQLYELLQQQIPNPKFTSVTFDLSESLDTKAQSNMIGPIWLKPFTLTYLDDSGDLHIATKGFVVDFTDPRYQKFPASWRGTHYCHFVAPDYFAAVLRGEAEAGAVIGREASVLRLPDGRIQRAKPPKP